MKATGLLRRLCADRSGASAVEFALVAPLFLAIIFSMFESGWLMTRSVMQDAALDRVIRDLRIDQTTTVDAAGLKSDLCARSLIFEDCQANTMVEMVTLRSTSDPIPETPPSCRHGGQTPRFVPGGQSDFVFIRVCTVVRPLTPLLGLAVALPDEASGSYGIVSLGGFVNEPR